VGYGEYASKYIKMTECGRKSLERRPGIFRPIVRHIDRGITRTQKLYEYTVCVIEIRYFQCSFDYDLTFDTNIQLRSGFIGSQKGLLLLTSQTGL
jgi:hypothetical protein